MRLRSRTAALAALLSLVPLLPAAAEAPARARPTFADEEVLRVERYLVRDIATPRALVDLARARSLIDETTDLPHLRDVFLRAAWNRRAHGEVRAYARWCLAQVEWRRGRRPQAARWISTLGVADRGAFVGPFDNEGGSGYDTAYPPEQDEAQGRAPDPSKALDGKEHPVHWRALPDTNPLGWVDLGSLVDPTQEVVVYVRLLLESDGGPAYLRLGSPGPTKVWVSGRLVHEDPADHPARFDQRAIPVTLAKGTTPVLLKLTQRSGSIVYYLRVTDEDGDRLRGVRVLPPDLGASASAAAETPAPAAAEAPAKAPPPADTVLGRIQKEVGARPKDAAARATLALVIAERRPFDRTERRALTEARAAAEASAPEGREAAEHWYLVSLLEDDENQRRMALEHAALADPGFVDAQVDLARHYLSRDLPRKALPHLEAALKVAPNDVAALLMLGDARSAAGFPEASERATTETFAAFPLAPRALSAMAGLDRSRGRLDQAEAHLRVATSLYPGDDGLRAALASVLLARGDVDGTVTQLRHRIDFSPPSVYTRIQLGELLASNGRADEAKKLLDETEAIDPDDPRVALAQAHAALLRGDRKAAEDAVARVKALSPQDHEGNELARLLTEDQDDFAAPWRGDLREVAAKAKGRAPEGEDVWTLLDLTVVRVHKNGLESRVQQEVHEALTERGAESLRHFSLPYTPGDQTLRILKARILKPDGTIVQARSERDQSLSEPWYRLYYDRRARIIGFSDVEPGDVVEVSWRVDDVAAENMFGDYFGDLAYLQGTRPMRHAEYVLIGPKDRKFYYNEVALPQIRHTEEAKGNQQILRWDADDVPKIVPEPGMPGWSEVAAFLHVSTYQKWSEVGAWWWRLIKDQLVPSPHLVSVAKGLVKDIPESDLRARVAAIHDYVVKHTRYVGLEFGIHGFKPYRVDQIYERRFGDCKDKASLMYAMLHAVGIDSRMVILRMRSLGRLPEYPASLAVFNHAILYVPALDLWLDGTAEFSGMGELPSQDRGASVIVVDPKHPEQSKFMTTPEADPSMNTSETDLAFSIDPKGDATATGRFEVHGTAAPGYRQGYQAEDGRRQKFEQAWAGNFPGVEVQKLEMKGLRDLETPVRAEFQLEVPHLAAPTAGGLELTPFGAGKGYTERYAALSSRSYDLVLGYPFVSRFRYQVRLPAGWSADVVPAPIAFDDPSGRFSMEWTREGDTLVASGEVTLAASRITVAAYPSFRAFLARIDRALSRKVHIAPGARASDAPAGVAPTAEGPEKAPGPASAPGGDAPPPPKPAETQPPAAPAR